jgi:molybdate transport system permease protein
VSSSPLFRALLIAALAIVLAFLALPIVAIFSSTTPGQLLSALDDPTARDALFLSLKTTLVALAIIVVFGTPAAYLLATRSFPGKAAVQTLIELPLVLPPAAAGIGLLAALGPHGLLGGSLQDAGITLTLQTAGVVVALVFVAAPFYLRQAESAFAAVPVSSIQASRTLGAGEAATFLRVVVPAARSGLLAGAALSWGRSLGEFGATLMFAGSFRGITQTVPLAIYDDFSDDFPAALALSAVLVCVSFALLLSVKLITGRGALGDAVR